MKNIFLSLTIASIFLSSCSTLKNTSYFEDEVYLDPKKDRNVFYPQPSVKDNKESNSIAVKSANTQTDNNPYYKDKDFNMDDYYDSEYASRIRRFHDPAYGLGYYDSFYTNSYFYNQNPLLYNVSIYNGYNFWGPSYFNYMFNPGLNWNNGYYGSAMGFGYSPWGMNNWGMNNWGMNNWAYGNNFYSPFGFNGLGYGFGSPFYNGIGFNNGFYPGYQNPFDYNSNTYYGPRMNSGGFNSNRTVIGSENGKSIAPLLAFNEMAQADPTSTERFNQVIVPKEHLSIIKEQKTLANSDPNYIPRPFVNSNSNSAINPIKNNVSDINPRNFENPVKQNNNPVRNLPQNDNPRNNSTINSSPRNIENPIRGRGDDDIFNPINSSPNNGSFESPRGGGNNGGGVRRPR